MKVPINKEYWMKHFKDFKSGHCSDNGFLMTPSSFQFANYFMNGYPVYTYSKIKVIGNNIIDGAIDMKDIKGTKEIVRCVWRDENYWYLGRDNYKYIFWLPNLYYKKIAISRFEDMEVFDYIEYLPPIKDSSLISNFNHFLKEKIEKISNTLQ
jgi:hypothetical protein